MRRDCLGHSPCLCCPESNPSAKPQSFNMFKILFKLHIFHETVPDSRCLCPIILITLIILEKVIAGCTYSQRTSLIFLLSLTCMLLIQLIILNEPTVYLLVTHISLGFVLFKFSIVMEQFQCLCKYFCFGHVMYVTEEDIII